MSTPSIVDWSNEFQQVLVTQGTHIRDLKHRGPMSDEEQGEANGRATRLLELAQLLGYKENPGKYVNDRIRAWLQMNPLPLTMEHVREILTEHPLYSLDGGVRIRIGDKGPYVYTVMRDDFRWSSARVEGEGDPGVVRGDMILTVPDSVAEYFRVQGRHELQSELRGLLNVSRA